MGGRGVALSLRSHDHALFAAGRYFPLTREKDAGDAIAFLMLSAQHAYRQDIITLRHFCRRFDAICGFAAAIALDELISAPTLAPAISRLRRRYFSYSTLTPRISILGLSTRS